MVKKQVSNNRICLPQSIDESKIEAEFKNGVLTVMIP